MLGCKAARISQACVWCSAAQARREARREAGIEHGDSQHPLNLLEIAGRSCTLHRAPQATVAAQETALIPWNGDTDNMIDRCSADSLG
jgi:hypothetical protein